MSELPAEISVNEQLSTRADPERSVTDWTHSPGEPQMTKQEAEQEAIRRWNPLPDDLRDSYETAEAYAERLDSELDFPTVTSRRRLIEAWLIREIVNARRLARESQAA